MNTNQKELTGKNRTFYITFLQVVSCIAVVVLHTNGCFWIFSKEKYWIGANIIECVCYFAVPVFFMITGITLIDYPQRYSTKVYFSNRVRKTVIPFFGWSMIGLIAKEGPKGLSVGPLVILSRMLSSDIIHVYWFFIPLFCIYLAMPLFAAIDRQRRRSIFIYLLIAGFTINNLIPFLLSVFHSDVVIPLSVSAISEYLIFPVEGIVLHENTPSRKMKGIIYCLGLAGFLLHSVGTYVLSLEAGMIVETYKGFANVPSILYSTAAFVLLRDLSGKIRSEFSKTLFRKLAKYTFPIYLMHYYIMIAINRIIHIDKTSLLYVLGSPIIIIAVIIPITMIMRKIPVVRDIVP